MKKIILSIALLSAPIITTANNFNMPGFNNGNGFNNGSSWNMPSMNWGNSNNGNNMSGSNWNMPAMNWGNGNGYNNGSNWNMPNMNWGNSFNNNSNGFPNASNWTMPTMNWGNGTSNYAPNVQYRAPTMPVAPQFIPRLTTKTKIQAPIVKKPVVKVTTPAIKIVKGAVANKIPMPSEVKGTILAPANKAIKVEATK